MVKVEALISAFKEFKEELRKATCSYTGKDAKLCPADCPCKKDMHKNVNASYSAATNATTGTSGGENSMYRSEKLTLHKNGQWSLDKSAAEEEKVTSSPHNKGKFKVMPMAPEKESKKANIKGEPYTPKADKK